MTKPVSSRINEIRPSGIRRIFEIACANPDGIDLSIGDPDFDVPDEIKEAGIRAARDGKNGYISTRGLPELREKLAAKLTGRKINFEDLLITAGATGGYYLAIMTVVSPGDEVLIIDPYFVAYANVVIMCGGVPKLVDSYPDFRLSEEKIAPLITDKTRAIVINTPGNPTGIVYDSDELNMIAKLAKKYNVHIISDEIYDQFIFDGGFTSIGNITDDAIIISGFSKTSGMTGWRLGYTSGPKEIIDAMATFQQYSYVCANSIAQHAAVAALDFDISEYVNGYRKRRDLIYETLKPNFKMRKPTGAFYLFPEAPGGDADVFVNAAIERKVFIIPGKVFSEKNTHFRISLAADESQLREASSVLTDIAKNFSERG